MLTKNIEKRNKIFADKGKLYCLLMLTVQARLSKVLITVNLNQHFPFKIIDCSVLIRPFKRHSSSQLSFKGWLKAPLPEKANFKRFLMHRSPLVAKDEKAERLNGRANPGRKPTSKRSKN